MVDVYYCYVLCGVTALLGAALTRVQSSSHLTEDTQLTLWLYRLGFAALAPLTILAVLPESDRAAVALWLRASCVMGVASMTWALAALNGAHVPRRLCVASIIFCGALVALANQLSPKISIVITDSTLILIGGTALAHQLRLWIRTRSFTRGELGLALLLFTFTAIFCIALYHVLTVPATVYPLHGLFMPPLLLPIVASTFAVLPLAVSALAFTVINERLVNRLQSMALTDELTGVLSRRGLRELGSLLVGEHQRAGRPVGVLMVDIDHFKRVNDSHGHAAGDLALKHVSSLLRGQLRANALLARYGGEEFTVLLPVDVAEEAVQAAERLREVVAQEPCAIETGALHLTVSIGVAMLDSHAQLEVVMNMADARLYEAKQSGRNRVVGA